MAAFSTKNPKNTDPLQALQNQAQKRELDSDGGDQWYSEYRKKYEEYYGNKNIYVAYGSGRNFETWAGPFLMKLTGAVITVKGPKKITLQLTPTASPLQITTRRGAYGEIVDLDLKGLMMSCNGHSKPIEFKNIKEGGEVYEVDKPDKIENIDFHSIVVDTIRNYIYKATGNSNVIVLLPNINQICSEEILAIATEQRVKKQEKKETRASELSKSRARADVQLAIDDEVKKIQETDAELAAAMGSVYSPGPVDAASVTAQVLNRGRAIYDAHPQLHFNTPASRTAAWDAFYAQSEKDMYAGVGKPTYPDPVTNRGRGGYRETNENRTYVYYPTQAELDDIPSKGAAPPTAPASKPSGNSSAGGKAGTFLKTMATACLAAAYYQELMGDGPSEDQAEKIGASVAFVRVVLSLLGLELTSMNAVRTEKGVAATSYAKEALYEVATDAPTAWKIFIEEPQRASLINESRKGIPKHWAALKSIMDKINNAALGIYSIEPITLTETSTKLLDFWDSYKDKTLFGGDIPFDKNKEAIIFGDLALINFYLYGANNQGTDTASAPLHPMDKEVFEGGYSGKINTLLRPKRTEPLVGAFGDVSFIPDSFGYKEDTLTKSEEKKYMGEEVPVFRFNTDNPNVIDLKFNDSSVYFAALQTEFQKEVNRRAMGIVEGVIESGHGSFAIRTPHAMVTYLAMLDFSNATTAKKKEILNGAMKKASPEIQGMLLPKNTDQLDAIIASFHDKALGSGGKQTIKISQLQQGTPRSVVANFAKQLYKLAIGVHIKTVPSFMLSSHWLTLSSPAILFAQDAPIMQQKKPTRTQLNSFMSGGYLIMGFKHKISSKSSAVSEFDLVKIRPTETKAVPTPPGGMPGHDAYSGWSPQPGQGAS